MDIKQCRAVEDINFPDGMLRLDYRSHVDGTQDWALILPPAGGNRWVFCIHGHGSHGDQLYTREDIRQCWLPCFKKHGLGIITPNLRDNAWMGPAAASDLSDLLDYLRQSYDAMSFVLASGSMGGTSNLIYAALHPENVAGVAALCPATDLASYHAWCRDRNSGVIKEIADAIESSYGGPPDQNPEIYMKHSVLHNADRLNMPVFIAHGNNDEIIPVHQPRLLAGKMGSSTNYAYIEVPDGGHDSPLSCIPDAFDWLMKRI